MARLEILPFADDHLDAAAVLLEERHRGHLATESLLGHPTDYRAQVEQAWTQPDTSGCVAFRDGQAIGYLVGSAPEGGLGIVGLAGHAVSEPEVARDLYCVLAERWSEAGVTRHAVNLPASDAPLIDAWFSLAFGLQFCTAVRKVAAEQERAGDVVVRAGRAADIELAATLDRALWEHQIGPPSFSGVALPPLADVVDEWGGTWSDPQYTHFVAERSGTPVGHALLYRRPAGDLRVPDRSIDLAQMVTLPAERGRGVGAALWTHAMSWADAQGFASMTIDWRTVNLLSSRFWRARGFRPTFYRLYRSIP